jgi:hypothetical protein
MGVLKRVASSVLLAGGIVFVFTGLSAALGFTAAGLVASIAAIAALLYAGGTWFGGAPATFAPAGGSETVIVFDRSLRIAAGATPGTPLLSHFPEPLRPEIEMACRLALRGEHAHFECDHAGARIHFDVSPVQSIIGMVLYGVLIAGSGMRVPAATGSPLATVA